MICKNCGNLTDRENGFCTVCGKELQPDEMIAESVENNSGQTESTMSSIIPTPQPMAPDHTPSAQTQKKPPIKKIILFGGLGLVVIIAAVIAVIALLNPKIRVSNKVEVNIKGDSVLEGCISADVSLNETELYSELTEKHQNTIFDVLYHGVSGYRTSMDFDLNNYCEMTVAVNDNEPEDNGFSYDLGDLSTTDTLHVTIKWKDDKESKRKLKQFCKKFKCSFDTATRTVDYSIAKIIKDNDIIVREPVEVDIFEKIDQMGAIHTTNFSEGNVPLILDYYRLEDFEVGDYLFKAITPDQLRINIFDGGVSSTGQAGVDAFAYEIYKDDEYRGGISFAFCSISGGVNHSKYLSEFFSEGHLDGYYGHSERLGTGDTVLVAVKDNLDKTRIGYTYEAVDVDTSLKKCNPKGTDILITASSKEYKIETPTPLTASEAKQNISMIEDDVKAQVGSEDIAVYEIDLLTRDKDLEYYDVYNALCVYYTQNDKMYCYVYRGAFISDGAFLNAHSTDLYSYEEMAENMDSSSRRMSPYAYISGRIESEYAGFRSYYIWSYSKDVIMESSDETADNDQGFDSAHPDRLVDSEKLLKEADFNKLTERLDKISEEKRFDIAIATVPTWDGKDGSEYADDFYDENGYGYGKYSDGIILMLSINEDEIFLSTCGNGITLFPVDYQDKILDEIIPHFPKGEYYEAFSLFIDLVEATL